MGKIAVITDSVATVPPDLVKKYDIHVVPLHIIWDNVEYKDGVDLSYEEFYARLRNARKLPTTSSAIQGEFIPVFEDLRNRYDGLAVFVLSGSLGACYSSALNAKAMFPDFPIEIVDTRMAMAAQGFIVVEAAKKAIAGGSMAEVVQAGKDLVPKMRCIWAMETLEYMRRGGRVSMSKALFATWLKVKPIVGIEGGAVKPIDRPRTMAKALERLLELMKEQTTDTPLHVAVSHAGVPEEGRKLKEEVASRFKCQEIWTTDMTPVIGTHVGPGALALSFYNE